MTELRYVITDEIKKAAVGRETDVLDTLNIDWRAGRPHIQCPYPDHTDNNPSWRWDERRAHAICTCTTNGHADGIFDVVAKVERIEFEVAKIRVAELLHRNDLIRTKSTEGIGQKQDAHSLLNAKAPHRDDRLPITYLAHRLGIAEDDVPRPSTRVVGLKSLGYYDPPVGKGEKPTLIAECPCAVFGTVAADGRMHAHRIYLASDGRGKADLGIGPNRKPRNPKKSAKIVGDSNTAGCAVLWGDPNTARHLIIFEGIENAAAGARAFKAETDDGKIAVASAINAGGIAAFQTYPSTRRVTIAADRDEATKNSKPGNRQGEIAARDFGLKHHEQIEVLIAMPGKPGELIDWLGILLREGDQAVRNGILGASAFVPTEEEIVAAASAKRQANELQAINSTYPLPQHLNSLRLEYRYASGGRVMMHREKKNPETKRKEWIPFATPFSLTSRLRYVDEADAYGLRCVVQDMSGHRRDLDFDRERLAKMSAADIRAALFRTGLRTEFDGEQIVVNILKAANPEREIIVVSRPGWHHVPRYQDDPIFVTPDGEIIGVGPIFNFELAIAARMPSDVARSGTLDDWQAAIATAMSVADCPHWTLGSVSGFAGPLASLTGLDTCGINLSGLTSSGKTFGQEMAASAWSSPSLQRKGLLQSAGLSANGIEAAAARSTGTILTLDDLGKLDSKLVAKMIYAATSGTAKQRLRPDGTACERITWSTFILLSSELGLEEIVRGVDGGKWLGGMAVRITDIDVTGVNRAVPREILTAIECIRRNHGHAGPAFVRALIDSGLHRRPVELRERILASARDLAGENADSAKIRAALPLAILHQAGTLAQSFELIPQSDGALDRAIAWAWKKFQKSSDAEVLDPETQAVSGIQTWIAERWDVTIKNVGARDGINNREAIGWYDDQAVYIPKDRLYEAAGKVLKRTQIANILNNQNLLVKKQNADRFTTDYVPKVGKVPAYALDIKTFGRREHSLEVIRGNHD